MSSSVQWYDRSRFMKTDEGNLDQIRITGNIRMPMRTRNLLFPTFQSTKHAHISVILCKVTRLFETAYGTHVPWNKKHRFELRDINLDEHLHINPIFIIKGFLHRLLFDMYGPMNHEHIQCGWESSSVIACDNKVHRSSNPRLLCYPCFLRRYARLILSARQTSYPDWA